MAKGHNKPNNHLAAYRGTASKDRVPAPVEDNLQAAPQPVEAPENESAPATPEPVYAAPAQVIVTTVQDDARNQMAARLQSRRAEERAALVGTTAIPRSHVPALDGDLNADGVTLTYRAPPPGDEDYIPGEDAEADAAVAASLAASENGGQPSPHGHVPAAPPAAAAHAPQTFQLKIDGNTLTVSREDLLSYAEVSEEEAAGLPAKSLVNLAQKQLAATARFMQARHAREQAKTGVEPALQAPQTPQPEPQRPQPQDNSAIVDMVREVQYGDPEVAAEKVAAIIGSQIRNNVAQEVRNTNLADMQQELALESAHAIEAFQQHRQDIVTHPILASAHAGIMARQIADDLQQLVPDMMTPERYQAIATNPKTAGECVRMAILEGRNIRRPAQYMEAAAAELDQLLGRQTPSPQPQPQPQPRGDAPAPQNRVEMKRRAPQTPARSGFRQQQQPQQVPGAPALPTDDRTVARKRAFDNIRQSRNGQRLPVATG